MVKITGDTFSFPDFQYAEKYYPQIYTSYTYLFSIDERNYYLPKDCCMESLPGFSMEDIIIFRNLSPQVNCFALITGYQLHNRYSIRKFCGKCGHPLVPDSRERMMYCPQCKNTEYPKISPAVIVGIRMETNFSYLSMPAELPGDMRLLQDLLKSGRLWKKQ